MSKYCELPSGRLIDMEDIIYVGTIHDKLGMFNRGYEFSVSWASRVTYWFKYDDYESCEKDWQFIKDSLKDNDNTTKNMICS